MTSVVQMVAALRALRKSAPSLALLADAMTFFSMVLSTWITPFIGGRGGSGDGASFGFS